MRIRANGRANSVAMTVCVAAVLAACSGSDGAVPETGPATAVATTVAEDVFSPGDSVADEMRPVPTVPPITVDGGVGDDIPEVPPTLVPPPPDPINPDVPATGAAPPSTDLVGDPQPSPNSAPNSTTSPTTSVPDASEPEPSDACTRLAAFGVGETISARSGSAADSVAVSNSVCRISSGALVVEVAFVPIGAVQSDWYLRDGVSPVGEVSGDAVGFASFLTPDGRSGAGYTIATVGGSSGVIVSVMAPNDARVVAAEVTVFAQQAA